MAENKIANEQFEKTIFSVLQVAWFILFILTAIWYLKMIVL